LNKSIAESDVDIVSDRLFQGVEIVAVFSQIQGDAFLAPVRIPNRHGIADHRNLASKVNEFFVHGISMLTQDNSPFKFEV